MQQKITLLTLGVKNLETTKQFYENTLGWKCMENSTDTILFIEMEGFILSFYPIGMLAKDACQKDITKGFKGYTLAVNLDSEKAVNVFIENMKAKGVQIIKEPQKAFWGGYSSYFSDPDGILWEIAHNPYL